MLDLPLLAGISRKSMIYKVLDSSAKEGTKRNHFLNMVCLIKGASTILRVTTCKGRLEAVRLYEKLELK
jgi:dihydropteroate synthase